MMVGASSFACGSVRGSHDASDGAGGVSDGMGGFSGGDAPSASGFAGDTALAGFNAGGSGDAAGGAGTSGAAAGVGESAGCSLGKIAACNDRDPCTRDDVDEACVCTHHALPDAATCDDLDACTQADHCFEGVCAGTKVASDARVTARLRSFGEGPGLQTLVAFPSAKRAIFASDRRLTLLGLEGGVVSLLDDIPMTASVRSDSVGSMVWASRPRTFVIPVLDHYVAVASIDHGIDLFDTSGDKLLPSETYGFGGGGTWPISAVTGAAARLYACTAFEVQTWQLDPSTLAITPRSTLSLAAGHRCQGLALAPDGKTLFVATNGGLEQIAIDTAGAMTLSSEFRPGKLVADVQANADSVAVYEVSDATSGLGNVVVLRRDSLEQQAIFKADLAATGTTPVGFALLDGKRILLQTAREDASGCTVQEAITLSLGASPVELDRRTTLEACESPFVLSSFHTVSNGSLAVLEPMHQLVQVGVSDGKLQLLNGPRQGSFERVRAAGSSSASVYSAGSLHRVDITDASAPRVEAGGLPSPLAMERLRLDLTDPASAALLTIDDAAQGGSTGPVTTLLRSNASGPPSVFGSIANDDPDGPWASAGTALYQLSARGAANFRIRRFRTDALVAASAQTLSADLDQEVVTAAPEALDFRRPALVAADPASGDLVVLEPRSNSTLLGDDGAVLSRYSFQQGKIQTRFSLQLESSAPMGLACSASLTVALSGGAVLVVDSSGNRSPLVLNGDPTLVVEGILDLDSEKLVLAVSWRSPALNEGALVLRTKDFSELARYPTVEPARSFAAVGEHWVFGTRSSLTVATPVCESPR